MRNSSRKWLVVGRWLLSSGPIWPGAAGLARAHLAMSAGCTACLERPPGGRHSLWLRRAAWLRAGRPLVADSRWGGSISELGASGARDGSGGLADWRNAKMTGYKSFAPARSLARLTTPDAPAPLQQPPDTPLSGLFSSIRSDDGGACLRAHRRVQYRAACQAGPTHNNNHTAIRARLASRQIERRKAPAPYANGKCGAWPDRPSRSRARLNS